MVGGLGNAPDSTLSRRASQWWSKLGPRGAPTHFHPLWCHALDTAAVAGELWARVLGRRVRHDLARAAGLDHEQARAWFAFLAAAHDIGKISPVFQAKARHARWDRAMRDAGTTEPLVGCLPHGVASQYVLRHWSSGRTNDAVIKHWAAIIGAHHGLFATPHALNAILPSLLGRGAWSDDRASCLAAFQWLTGAPWACAVPDAAMSLSIAGLLTVADWLASDERLFPYAYHLEEPVPHPDLDGYFAQAHERASRALTRTRWLTWDAPPSDPTFAALFPSIPTLRPLQAAVVALPDAVFDAPGLIVVEAPMGEGKTEAALYLAARWSARLGRRGVYVALPTQATSNQMYGRVLEAIEAQVDDAASPYLLHGFAVFHEEFAAQIRDSVTPSGVGDSDDEAAGASAWFTGRKRGLLAPYAVGTIDQVMMAALQAKHVTVRLCGLHGKVVVLDEVHAYDTYMTTIIERLLEWLAALGSPVVLLSATLPQDRRVALCAGYARGAGARLDAQPSTSYPRLTTVAPALATRRETTFPPSSTRRVGIEVLEDDAGPSLGATVARLIAPGGCALVISNTVRRAQQAYTELRSVWPSPGTDEQPVLELLHARYPQRRRLEREQRLLSRYSRHGTRPARAVVVATQVVEQSLDVDFDVLVSDLAPIDLLLQRVGRVHRHTRPRPAGCETPRLILRCGTVGASGLPDLERGSAFVYGHHLLWRSWLALQRHGATIRLPDDIEPLVEEVYKPFSRDGAYPEAALDALRESWLRLKTEEGDAVAQARLRYLKPPQADLALWAYCPDPLDDDDDPALHPLLRAATRLTSTSVRVACVVGDESAAVPDDTGPPIDLRLPISVEDTSRLVLSTLTIHHPGLVPGLLDVRSPATFRLNPWLRHSRLLYFDREWVATFGDWRCRLDPELGLLIDKVE